MPQTQLTGLRRILALALGICCVCLAVIGIALPGIPTTPFLLLASYFLIRSSPSLHRRLLKNRFLGPIIRDWEAHRSISRGMKIWAVVVVTICLITTLSIGSLPVTARYVIAALICVGLVVVLRLPVTSDPQ